MFEDVINRVRQVKEEFQDHISDSFGRSIVNDVFDPLEAEEQKLHYEYEMAEGKMNEVKVLTAELRMIL